MGRGRGARVGFGAVCGLRGEGRGEGDGGWRRELAGGLACWARASWLARVASAQGGEHQCTAHEGDSQAGRNRASPSGLLACPPSSGPGSTTS